MLLFEQMHQLVPQESTHLHFHLFKVTLEVEGTGHREGHKIHTGSSPVQFHGSARPGFFSHLFQQSQCSEFPEGIKQAVGFHTQLLGRFMGREGLWQKNRQCALDFRFQQSICSILMLHRQGSVQIFTCHFT